MISPLFLIIALLIKIDSKGPVFYISKRAGTGYKVFNFYKFRTMKIGADKELNKLKDQNQYAEGGQALFYKIDKDPRVTKIGRFLRNTSLDELPQIVNVIKGNMSLVGNRPLPLYEAMQLTRDQWAMRFNAPAGITGLWQVTKRGKKDMSEEERIRLDISYAKRNSFLFDIKILFKTLPAAIQRESV
jgi:lipopolysaccharide/colanic/teichoic acid biosynthesis glycosyltransferase